MLDRLPTAELTDTTVTAEPREVVSDCAALEPASSMRRSVLMSLAFWLVLLVAAGCYAAVALTPKLAEWMRIRQTYAANIQRLAELDRVADESEQFVDAMKRDATLAERLPSGTSAHPASLPDGGSGTDAESGLLLNPRVASAVVLIASSGPHRTWLLWLAGSLTVFAFAFLNDAMWRVPLLFRRWKVQKSD